MSTQPDKEKTSTPAKAAGKEPADEVAASRGATVDPLAGLSAEHIAACRKAAALNLSLVLLLAERAKAQQYRRSGGLDGEHE